MIKKYQKNTSKTGAGPVLAVPHEVTVSEIADDMREGLLALAVSAGLQVMSSLMEADVVQVRRLLRTAVKSTLRTSSGNRVINAALRRLIM